MELREYLVFAVVVSAVMGVVGALSHSALSAECESAIGVICLSLLIAPIVNAVGSSEGFPLPPEWVEAGVSGDYADVSADAFVSGVRTYISSEYSLDPNEVLVIGDDYSFSEARMGRLTVRLSGTAALADTRSIREEISDLFLTEDGECRVVVSIE